MLLTVPGGTINTTARTVNTATASHPLREKEARIIEVLASHNGRTVSPSCLLREVFHYSGASKSRTLLTTIGRTRKALVNAGLSADLLQNVYGEGYRWSVVSHPRPPSLIGRQEEHSALFSLLANPEHRLITLVGMGGIGKTTLLKSVLFANPQALYVSLAERTSAAALSRAITSALGATPNNDVRHSLSHQNISLLLLDNVEQLLGPLEIALPTWLLAQPDLQVVCTSRLALELPTETLLPIGPLPDSDARRLFTKRAPHPVNDAHLSPLLNALNGHPLAIELAASRTSALSLPELLSRLTHSHAVLTDTLGTHERRHSSSHALVNSALDLLDSATLGALYPFTLFVGPTTKHRLLHTLHDPGQHPEHLIEHLIEALIERLVHHHLVSRTTVNNTPVFQIHSAVRSCVVELHKQRAEPLLTAAASRLLRQFTDEALQIEQGRPAQVTDDDWLTALHIATTYNHPEQGAVLLLGALSRFERGHDPQELRPFLDTLCEQLPPTASPTGATVRLAIVRACLDRLHDPDGPLTSANHAVTVARALSNPTLLAMALQERAQGFANQHQHARCVTDLAQCSAIHQQSDNHNGVIRVNLLTAVTAIRRWDLHGAGLALNTIEANLSDAGFEHRFRYEQLRFAVDIETAQWSEAEQTATRLVRLSEQGTREHQAWALLEYAYYHACSGHLERSRQLSEEALDLASQGWLIIRLLCNISGMRARERRWAEARRLLNRALTVSKTLGGRAHRLALLRASWLARLSGDLKGALSIATRTSADRSAHLGEVTEEPLLYAQSGDLCKAISAQRRVHSQLASSTRVSETTRAAILLAELLLANGELNEAQHLLTPIAHHHSVQPYERARLQAALNAASGVVQALPKAPDALTELDNLCWVAFAHRRAGDALQANNTLEKVRAALIKDRLPSTSELAWRLRVAERG